jgi:hypothetical protein
VSGSTWRRVGAATGAAGALIYVQSAFSAGAPLKPDASLKMIVSHFIDKRAAVLTGMLLAFIAVALLIWFLGYLREFLAVEGKSPELANVTLVSCIALLAITVGGSVPLTGIVWRGAGQADPRILQLAFDVGNLSLYSVSAGAALLSVLAPSIVIWRSGVLPRWIAVLGAIEIAVNVVELAGFFTRTGVNASGYAAGLGPFLWIIWVAAVSIAMVLRIREKVEGPVSSTV